MFDCSTSPYVVGDDLGVTPMTRWEVAGSSTTLPTAFSGTVVNVPSFRSAYIEYGGTGLASNAEIEKTTFVSLGIFRTSETSAREEYGTCSPITAPSPVTIILAIPVSKSYAQPSIESNHFSTSFPMNCPRITAADLIRLEGSSGPEPSGVNCDHNAIIAKIAPPKKANALKDRLLKREPIPTDIRPRLQSSSFL